MASSQEEEATASKESALSVQLLRSRHSKYLSRTLGVLPASAAAFDTSRATLAFFALSGLDVLRDSSVTENAEERRRCLEWIKSLYVLDESSGAAGFHGGAFIKTHSGGFLRPDEHCGHIAMTYSALACLALLGAQGYLEEQFDRGALARGVAALQRPDGSFNSSTEGGENDMRFVFCAAAVCAMLGGKWAGVDKRRAVDYVLASVTYEGGIGQQPGLEAHGGSTFCGVAALALMGELEALGQTRRRKLVRWLLRRLADDDSGFNGRPNKPSDTCYSFWVGAALRILAPFDGIEKVIARSAVFSLSTQDEVTGGMAKWKDNSPDPLHTYMGLAGLSLGGFAGLEELAPAYNITKRAAENLRFF